LKGGVAGVAGAASIRTVDQSLQIGENGKDRSGENRVTEMEKRDQSRRDALVLTTGAVILGLLFVLGLVGLT
jgi:hypothetical protein